MLHKSEFETALSALKKTLLPEIYEVLSYDEMARFLYVFGGTTIRVPTVEEIIRTYKEIDIYNHLSNGTDTLQNLATKHDLSEDRVQQLFEKIEKQLQEESNKLPDGVVRTPRVGDLYRKSRIYNNG